MLNCMAIIRMYVIFLGFNIILSIIIWIIVRMYGISVKLIALSD